jgi:hypothetical protein
MTFAPSSVTAVAPALRVLTACESSSNDCNTKTHALLWALCSWVCMRVVSATLSLPRPGTRCAPPPCGRTPTRSRVGTSPHAGPRPPRARTARSLKPPRVCARTPPAAHNGISSEGVASLVGLQRLRRLDLSHNGLDSAEALEGLLQPAAQLQSLDLRGNPLCRWAGSALLARLRPAPYSCAQRFLAGGPTGSRLAAAGCSGRNGVSLEGAREGGGEGGGGEGGAREGARNGASLRRTRGTGSHGQGAHARA